MHWEKDSGGRPIYYDRYGNPMTLQQLAQKFEDEDYKHIVRNVVGPDEPLDPAPLITVSTFSGHRDPNATTEINSHRQANGIAHARGERLGLT